MSGRRAGGLPARLGALAGAWAILGGAALGAMVLVTTANIALFAADRVAGLWGGDVAGLPGYEDFVRLAVSAAALMFLPWCQHRRGHIAVDFVAGRLPPRLVAALDRAWAGLTAALALFLLAWMAQGMTETRADGVLSPILGWPEWPFYLPGLASLALWSAVAGAQALAPGGADG